MKGQLHNKHVELFAYGFNSKADINTCRNICIPHFLKKLHHRIGNPIDILVVPPKMTRLTPYFKDHLVSFELQRGMIGRVNTS